MPLPAPFTAVLAATPAPPSRPCHTRRGPHHGARGPVSRSPLPRLPRNLARWLYAPHSPCEGRRMRKVTIGVLGILAVGCASTATFELAPRDHGARWLADQQWVERRTDDVVIVASFERSWLDRLLFDVSVTNRSGSTISVD